MNDAENASDATSNPTSDSPPPAPTVASDNQRVLGKTEAQEREEEIQETQELISQNTAANKETRTIEWLQFGVNAALAVIGAIAIIVYIGQLSSMNKTLAEIQKQTPEIQRQANTAQDQLAQAKIDSAASSEATTKQIDAAQKQAEAAQRSLDILRNQFAQDQRPYIVQEFSAAQSVTWTNGRSVVSKDPEPGKAVSVTITYRNVGKSSAIKFRSYRHVVFGEDGLDNSHADAIILGDGTVEPPGGMGGTTAISLKDTYSSESAIIDPAELLAWNGKDQIFVFGAFTYSDRFGNYYCTPFRALWLADSAGWLNSQGFTEIKSKKHRNGDELCPKHEKQSGAR